MRDIIRKILKEESEISIPTNIKGYVDKALEKWETDPMRSKEFITNFGLNRDMAIYIRQKIAEQLSKVPTGRRISVYDKDFPEDISIGNYDITFEIINLDNLFPYYLLDETHYDQKRIVSYLLSEEIGIDVKLSKVGSVHINIRQDDGEYELIEMPIMEAIHDEEFGWEVESEIKDIVWSYVVSFSPLAQKFHIGSEITFFS